MLETVGYGNLLATYQYEASSALLKSITFSQNGQNRLTLTRFYDTLNRLTKIEAVANGQTISSQYGYNLANQRTAVTNADNSRWSFEYDDLGQVTEGKKHQTDGTPINDRQFEYGFDDTCPVRDTFVGSAVGKAPRKTAVAGVTSGAFSHGVKNRLSGESNTVAATYAPDLLNQYDSRTIGQGTENFTHDLDGNLTQDDRWDYAWDAENRLVRMVTRSGVTPARRLEFAYDYQGRRIRKRVWDNTAGTGNPILEQRFVYDGWNLICTLSSALSPQSSFVWGLDLSGAEQGAGGVGGLLMFYNPTFGWYFAAPDGNGNVLALVDEEGNLGARYEYGPFGELHFGANTLELANPFRFSTKFQDDETGFLYYGYRYYDPDTGRWLSRDPIGENDVHNLYVYVHNAAPILIDPTGLLSVSGFKWMKTNCRTLSVGFTRAIYDEIGGSLSVHAIARTCDCFNCDTGENVEDGYWIRGVDVELEIGFGVGFLIKNPFLGQIGGLFKGPQAHFQTFPISVEKECDQPEARGHTSFSLGNKWGGEVNLGSPQLPANAGLNASGYVVPDVQLEIDVSKSAVTIAFGIHLHGAISVSGSLFGVQYEKQFSGHDLEAAITHTFSFK